MTDQQTPPTYSPHGQAPSMFTPPSAVQPTKDQPVVRTTAGRKRRTGLLAWVGPVLAVLAVVLTYVVLRWSPEPVLVVLGVTGALLVALTVCGFVAARRGVVAPYVAIALLLPYLLAASAALGSAERVSSELEDLFSSSDDSSSGNLTFDWDESESTAETEAEIRAYEMSGDAVPFGATGEVDGFEVTVDQVECGLRELKGALERPARDAEDGRTAKAATGKTFCLVESTWTNVSDEPAIRSTLDAFTGVVTADDVRYDGSDDDQTYSAVLTARTGFDGGTVNPGDSVGLRSAFSVPRGTQPQYVVASAFALDPTDGTYFEVPTS